MVCGILLVLGFGAAREAAAAPCELHGSPPRAQIRVRVPGHAPLELELTDREVVARFMPGSRTLVETFGPLRIVGEAVRLPLALARPVVAAGGQVGLSTAVKIVRARARGAGLGLDVEIAGRTELGAFLPAVVVACDAVKIREDDARAGKVELAGDFSWIVRKRSLVLRTRPDGPPRLRLRATEPGMLRVAEVDRRGDRIHVRAAWSDGSFVQGWAERAALTPIRSYGFGWGSWGETAEPVCRQLPPFPRPGGYVGAATLRAGATLHAAPGRGAWAEASEDVAVEVEIDSVADAAWVHVGAVPGISESCGRLEHAWVARDQIVLPVR